MKYLIYIPISQGTLMKKIISLLGLIFLISFPIAAQQSKTIIDEQFYSNKNNWPVLDEKNVETEVDEGYYIIECSDEDGYVLFRDIDLDYSKNFSILVSCGLEEGPESYGFGFYFGFRDWNNYFKFAVAPTGYYRINSSSQGVFSSTGWRKHNNVRGKGSQTTLKIVKINDWIGFYVGKEFTDEFQSELKDVLVHTMRIDGFAGKQFALGVDSKQKVKFDEVVIKELGPDELKLYTDDTTSKPDEEKQIVLFSDDFHNNNNNWYTESVDTNSIKAITDGVYSFDCRRPWGMRVTQNVFLSAKGNYDIECTSKWVSGADDSYYGLLWGFKDWKNYQEFVINPKGSFRYLNTVKGSETPVTGSYQPQVENKLRVSRMNDSLYFYINGTLVTKAADYAPAGREAGFVLYNKQKVLFDDLKISQMRPYAKVIKEKIVADETLQENKGTFSDKETTSNTTKVWKQGALECTHTGNSGNALWDEYYVDPSQDFTIKEKIKWIGGDSTSSFGIVWGHKDWDNYNEFIIRKNGFYKAITDHNKEIISGGWKITTALSPDGNNTLEVRKRGTFVEYYINDQLVDVLPFYKLYGYHYGMLVYGNQTVALEGIKITEHRVAKPDMDLMTIAFSEDYDVDKPALQGATVSGNQIMLTDKGVLHLAAIYPHLKEYTESEMSSYNSGYITYTKTTYKPKYPSEPFYQYYENILPMFSTSGKPRKAFTAEATVGIMTTSYSKGAGIRIGGYDYVIDPEGNCSMGLEAPKKIDDLPSKKIFRIRLECSTYGLVYFYVNDNLVDYKMMPMQDRYAGPVIYAFKTLTEAWFDDFVVKTYN